MSFRNSYNATSYSRNRETGRTSALSERPTSVTAKYINPTSAFKTSSIPILCNDRLGREETPISTVANRYTSYNKGDKTTKYEKKDFNKMLAPTTIKSRDVSPISIPAKYGINKSSRHISPDRKLSKSLKDKKRDISPANRDKDIPSKTDKSISYSNLSSYKLYPRTTNYNRTATRTDTKPEVTVNRYAIASRLSTNYLKNSTSNTSTSIPPVNISDTNKTESSKQFLVTSSEETALKDNAINTNEVEDRQRKEIENDIETICVVTRHTSPTPPGSSAYVRSRRADLAKTIENTITRFKKRPEMIHKEIQSDRLDDPTRSSRYGSTSRTSLTNWSYYSPVSHNYTGYAGRYSTQYSNLREHTSTNSNERNTHTNSAEHLCRESSNHSICKDNSDDKSRTGIVNEIKSNSVSNVVDCYDSAKEDDTSEIIINVNLKLKQAKTANASTELVSPEITIASNQLPPQPPKPDGANKVKKSKSRKSSTDSSSDTNSKKKVVKRRSKSNSSTDSDHCTESSSKKQDLKTKSSSKINTSLLNGPHKSTHSKSRESNSPESSTTLSIQSSVSEDESNHKFKSTEITRPLEEQDKLNKQPSPLRTTKIEGATEEAKSFLIRALAPVTNLFKLRHQDSIDHIKRLENSSVEITSKDGSFFATDIDKSNKGKLNTDNTVASNDERLVKLKSVRPIETSDKMWWLNSEDDEEGSKERNDMVRKMNSDNDLSNDNQTCQLKINDNLESMKPLRKYALCDDEKPWWLDSSANVPEGIERLTPPRKSSSDSDKSEKLFKIRNSDSGGQKDYRESSSHLSKLEIQNGLSRSSSEQKNFPLRRIRHVESGEQPWWLSSDNNIPEGIEKLPTPPAQTGSDSSDSEEVHVYVPLSHIPPFPLHLPDEEPLGDRRSPEGLETPEDHEIFRARSSPYENNRHFRGNNNQIIYQRGTEKYISRYTDIDDILGTSGQIYSPFLDSILARRTGQMSYDDDDCEEIDPTQVRIHDSTAQRPVIRKLHCRSDIVDYQDEDQLDDVTLQVFKDGDYGAYLDLDSTLGEQDEELEGLQDNRKNALILRTQLSVRVHAIIERLLQSQGRELRRALFTLKQILQSDKDLVHEFVANKGLDCLMQVANMADHNYLDYILRALGQVLLYVDGMHGVMTHKRCIQWLYSLISSRFRHIVKTALKLLLVFVEYTDKNSLLLIDAIRIVDNTNGRQPWYNVMKILKDFDASDTELLIYATTLINRCLNNVPDRDTYYDQVDALQDQGIDDIIQMYMSKQGTDLDLLRQLQTFEAVLLYEDGDETGTALELLDDSVITSVRRRSLNLNNTERRKSKKQQIKEKAKQPAADHMEPETNVSHNLRSPYLPTIIDNKENKELNSALRRRRDRFARQAHHTTQQQELLNNSSDIYNGLFGNKDYKNSNGSYTSSNGNFTNPISIYTKSNCNYTNTTSVLNRQVSYFRNGINVILDEDKSFLHRAKSLNLTDVLKNGGVSQRYPPNLKQRMQNGTPGHNVNSVDSLTVIRQKTMDATPEIKDEREIIKNREHSIKDIAQMLTSTASQPAVEDKHVKDADLAGIVLKAKEELAKSQSKEMVKSPNIEKSPKIVEVKVSENDLNWEEIKERSLNRDFHLCDLDFSELGLDSDDDIVRPSIGGMNGAPPPPPNMFPPLGMPPPLPTLLPQISNNNVASTPRSLLSQGRDTGTIKKNKKTVKLFWREIQENPVPDTIRLKVGGFIWDELPDITLDTTMLEHLFESRTNDLIIKEKLLEPKRNIILDAKRSNAINIAMKKLPTPQTIKAAIMKMDATVIGREGIEKLLTMLPTEEEKIKIQEAQYANPNLPLGSAEQFLLTLASVNELSSRLKLWVFRLDFDYLEKEIAEPLMDLKQGIELLKVNKTFKVILSTLRSVGSFLNGCPVKGFRLEYLSKVMEVKDTVHKHPLLYHICEMIIEKFPDSTDFFSEVGPVIRASKVDFDVLSANLQKLEADCKASWDHMKRVAKHDSSQIFKTKINEFLTDSAERIVLLDLIKKRVMNRYNKFLLFLGVPPGDLSKTKPSEFLKVIAEFALEYRTTRERVLQQLEKRAKHRERNKTRGKMIIDVGNYSNKNGDHVADGALKELLKTDLETDSLIEGRRKSKPPKSNFINGDLSADDEIIESLVRSATSKRRPVPREKRKNRISSNKKYFNRTLDGQA
ncbi:FH1/FH2 domain-containing protein 3 [Battus philenor]|uniref:FH1/FH2 domain-containing protein 3 n=1 Tax=Battus philenor TaxID=42288 RepID=UPI0035D02290